MRGLAIALIASALAACTTAPEPGRSAEAEAQLNKLLAGRTAGAPVSCLQTWQSDNMVTIDDNTVVFRDGRRVYRNDFRDGGCNRLGSGNFTLVTRTTGSGLCSGDIAQIVDIANGFTVGSCVLGEFVPYELTGR